MEDIKVHVWSKGEKAWSWYFLSTYPIMVFLGFVMAFLTVAYFWRRQKYPWEQLQILLIIIVPTALFGARAWYILFPPEGVRTSWNDFFRFEGLAIQGGVMMAALSGSLYILIFQRHVIDFRTGFGMIIPSVILGQAIGRWGNFHNHEVFGAPIGQTISMYDSGVELINDQIYITSSDLLAKLGGSSLDWLTFIKPHMLIEVNGQIAYRQPFFFYESMLNLFGYLVMIWFLFRKNYFKPGTTGAIYFIWYGIVRFIMEPLRDPSDIMKSGGANLSQIFSALWITFGVLVLIWFQVFTKPFDKWLKKILPEKWMAFLETHWLKEYQLIKPIKPRRIAFFGQKVEYKQKYLMYWGPKVENRVRLWIVKTDRPWTKREINQGKKNKPKFTLKNKIKPKSKTKKPSKNNQKSKTTK